jgi:hypothetical protein
LRVGSSPALLIARAALGTVSRLPARSAAALRANGAVFVAGEFAITIFIQLFQSGRRVGNLVGIDNAITIRIQRREQRGERWTTARPVRFVARRWGALILGGAHLCSTN